MISRRRLLGGLPAVGLSFALPANGEVEMSAWVEARDAPARAFLECLFAAYSVEYSMNSEIVGNVNVAILLDSLEKHLYAAGTSVTPELKVRRESGAAGRPKFVARMARPRTTEEAERARVECWSPLYRAAVVVLPAAKEQPIPGDPRARAVLTRGHDPRSAETFVVRVGDSLPDAERSGEKRTVANITRQGVVLRDAGGAETTARLVALVPKSRRPDAV
jgi:hypothetical protein